jgi:hypothetical protein
MPAIVRRARASRKEADPSFRGVRERKTAHLKDFTLTEEGEVKAAFAQTGVVDFDADYTFPGAFPTKDLPISAYGHNSWPEKGGLLPSGKGSIKEVGDLAILEGQFFIDTTAGRDTYLTVKHMADLQEWSYGYDVTKTAPPPAGMKARRGIKALDVFEVSPVLLGAGIGTRTLDIKGRSHEAKAAIDNVYQATTALSAILCLIQCESDDAAEDAGDGEGDGDESTDVATLSQARDLIAEYIAATAAEVGTPDDLEDIAEEAAARAAAMATMPSPSYGWDSRQLIAAIKGGLPAGRTFAESSARLLRDAQAIATRASSIAEMRTKGGRGISTARGQTLRSHADLLREAAKAIDDLVDTADPKKGEEEADAKRKALHRDQLYALARYGALTSHSTTRTN